MASAVADDYRYPKPVKQYMYCSTHLKATC